MTPEEAIEILRRRMKDVYGEDKRAFEIAIRALQNRNRITVDQYLSRLETFRRRHDGH